jgi:hypothetical protein
VSSIRAEDHAVPQPGAVPRPGGLPGPWRQRFLARFGVAGATATALITAALGVAHVLTSGGPLSLADLGAAPAPAPVSGRPGLAPGGAPVPVVFTVGGPPVSAGLTVTGVALAAAGLPLDCPPQAWTVEVPAPVRISPGTAQPRIPATVALADDAPWRCQGLTLGTLIGTVSAVDAEGSPVTLDGTADVPLAVATLGTPGAAVTEESGQAVVVTTPGLAAPPGTRYTVEVTGADRHWKAVCQLRSAAPCATGQPAGAAGARYRVTAWLGSFWRRTSAELRP